MPKAVKQDSNSTGLALAREENLGELGGSPRWVRLQPNSYGSFGINLSKIAPNPINDSRQRKKGVITDLDAQAGGISVDMNFFALQEVIEAAMFADIRRKPRQSVVSVASNAYDVPSTEEFAVGHIVKGFNFTSSTNNSIHVVTSITAGGSIEVDSLSDDPAPSNAYVQAVGYAAQVGDLEIDTTGDFSKIVSTNLNFTSLGLVTGQFICIGGDGSSNRFSNEANNGFKRIRSISESTLVIDKSERSMITEAGASKEIYLFFGDVIRNERGTDIVRRSFHAERTLGAEDTSQPNQIQSEIVQGCVLNEFSMNVPTTDKATMDLNFVGTNYLTRSGETGPLQENVQNPLPADILNTSSDVPRINLALVSNSEEAPEPLFAFAQSMTISVNNNVTGNKAIGVLGSFEVTTGTFEVSANPSVYFGSVAAIEAVRANSDVTLDVTFTKENLGITVDLPLVSLDTDGLEVTQDEAVTLGLNADAADADPIAAGYDHTMMVTLFGHVPNSAG